ncbi:fetal and adult testis-expressed transcript protein-like isoform X1 [Rhineura floridana]|uniref:fetal and adult testis-expressed transcript protein-like isoform X1 n=1 Tax=Rhineura floridana TaxID=261503 RepID=UPI002AC81AFD|nr:fetal and adult testis-expressed transcript protein-like isoform X1 [Rhineura floridana]
MWLVWSKQLDQAPCDVGFTEATHGSIQVPSRLKVADGPSAGDPPWGLPEACPPSFRMHVPQRLLLAEMMTEAAFSPPFGNQPQQQRPLPINEPLLGPSIQPTHYGEHPFLSFASQPGSQKRKWLMHQSSARKERALVEPPPVALGAASQRHDWLEPSMPPPFSTSQFPPFPLEGRIYSLQNVLRALRFLGHQLFQLFWKPGRAERSSQEVSLVLESSLEDFGTTEILTLRKQLMKISGRLLHLERQCVGWRQKEWLVYSALVSAGLLNVWLWLRR